MSSSELKTKFHQLIDEFQNPELLAKAYELLFLAQNNRLDDDWWDELSPEQKRKVEKSRADVEAGRVIPHEEVMENAKKWLLE